MTQSQPPYQNQAPAPQPTGKSVLRQGLWNYAMDRWAPKTQPARIIVEMTFLIAFFLVLAILLRLSAG
jgi:hypothetical protein